MAEKGWSAEGRLTPLYRRYGGGKRLAELTDLAESTIRQINSGKRNMGIAAARKIVANTDATLADLGTPARFIEDDPASVLLDMRVRALELGHETFRQHLERQSGESLETIAQLRERLQGEES